MPSENKRLSSGNPSRLSALIEALRLLADGQPVSDIPFEGRSKSLNILKIR
jgi:hypothetical protein